MRQDGQVFFEIAFRDADDQVRVHGFDPADFRVSDLEKRVPEEPGATFPVDDDLTNPPGPSQGFTSTASPTPTCKKTGSQD